MFVVAGVTGNTGSVVADALLAHGKKVKVVVRDAKKGEAWRAKGAEVAVGSVEDPQFLAQAFVGAEGVYLLIPPSATTENHPARGRRITEGYVEALSHTHVPHVAFLSSVAAHVPSGTGPIVTVHYAEERLPTVTGTRFSFVRAAYFMENLGMIAGLAKAQGILPAMFDASKKIDMVATKDIGLTAARALLETPTANEHIELSGPETYSFTDAAALFSKALGKPVQTVPVPREAVVPSLLQAGLSKNMAETYAEMNVALDEGRITFEGGGARRVRGATTLAEIVAKLV
ncbi:NmrA family NAD(P)-binding protein [Myxococcota bacterium]|nr:NmrA family NAD(P)-binding protein [Myxococcota bacterium]